MLYRLVEGWRVTSLALGIPPGREVSATPCYSFSVEIVGLTRDITTSFPYKNEFVKQWNKINTNGMIYSTDNINKTNSKYFLG